MRKFDIMEMLREGKDADVNAILKEIKLDSVWNADSLTEIWDTNYITYDEDGNELITSLEGIKVWDNKLTISYSYHIGEYTIDNYYDCKGEDDYTYVEGRGVEISQWG